MISCESHQDHAVLARHLRIASQPGQPVPAHRGRPPPLLEQHLGRGGISSQIKYVLQVQGKKSVFPTFNLLFLSLLG